VLIEWAEREQGLVLAPGNPRGLHTLRDLAETRARVMAPQPGSGVYQLLEALLAQEGLSMAELALCDRPALTEGDVASAVADGEADCGLAIGAVARRFGLDFVPLHRERFDLACRRRDYFEAPLQSLFALTRTEPFAQKAAQLGYYTVRSTGNVRFNA
jgi:putative molybdopterin biosynthesis protein